MKYKLIKLFIGFYLIITIPMSITWTIWHIMNNGKMLPKSISNAIIYFASFPSHLYHTLNPIAVPYNVFDPRQITNTNSVDGIKLFGDVKDISPISLFISTFTNDNKPEFKLIQIPDGKLIKNWEIPKNTEIDSIMREDKLFRGLHPIMTKDSSVIFKYNNGKFLISISEKNKINWTNSELHFHHSEELENDSTLWAPAITKDFKYYKIDKFKHDAICSIDIRTGKIKFIKSVADILIENGYQSLLDLLYEDDAIHLNDIQPATYLSKYWEKGDLLLSLRNRNTILLYRPKSNKITWLKTGPWLSQHDCDFVDDKTIMVYGNDILRKTDSSFASSKDHNEIYFYNFEKNEITKPYTKVMKKTGINTKTEGRCDLLPNGDLFIDETNKGKLYIINKDSVKMIYTERYDKNHIKMFNWVRPILN